MAGVPVAVIIKAAGLFEDARQFHTTRPHVIYVSLRGFMAVFKGALLLGLAPEGPSRTGILVVAVRVEGRVNGDEVHAGDRKSVV